MLAYIYMAVLVIIALLAVMTFMSTMKTTNPYGRYADPNDKGSVASRPAWLIFESPQWWSFALTFLLTAQITNLSLSVPSVLLFALWQAHYIYRAILYPLRRHDKDKRFPMSGIVLGVVFNALNGFANAYAVGHAEHLMGVEWFSDPRFIIGLSIAVIGWLINFQADTILINLRRDGSSGHRIPHGGAFTYVSAANYFGEIVLWIGWAIMSWTMAGLLFAIFTLSNLLPRALSHHRWYQNHFPDYPKRRKAVFPFIL